MDNTMGEPEKAVAVIPSFTRLSYCDDLLFWHKGSQLEALDNQTETSTRSVYDSNFSNWKFIFGIANSSTTETEHFDHDPSKSSNQFVSNF